jgi:transposase InsO family protein
VTLGAAGPERHRLARVAHCNSLPKRFHYNNHDQLKAHLADFMAAYNFARRLKTLGGLTPYEYICKIWTSEPDRFILNPIHQMPGLNT